MDTDFFLSSRPTYPWSIYPLGFPAFLLVAVLLVLFTLWTYLGHPQATRRRVVIVLALRLGALIVALLTAVRPSVGVQEDPKVPSVLLIGVDESESMRTADETGQPRINAVKETLRRCQPVLDELAEQNVEVVFYKFSTPDFQPDTAKFDPKDEADGKRSDYGTYLNRTHDRWQAEKFVRGHIVIGDGRDNGLAFSAVSEAGRWGRRGVPVTTVAVGDENTTGDKKDIRVVSLSCVPRSAPIKTDVEVVAEVNAYNFRNEPVKARVFVDDQPVLTEEFTLTKPSGNLIRMKIKAPEKPGEVKVRLAVGREENVNGVPTIVPVPGELDRDRPANNNSKRTRLTVTKEGVRILVIDRLRWEETLLRDALRGEKRFDVVEVIRQSDDLKPTPEERKFLDLDANAYDVVIIGNVPISGLTKQFDGRPVLDLAKVVERVEQKGMGLMFLGGERAFEGMPPQPAGDPRQRGLDFADLVPVTVMPGDIVEAKGQGGQPAIVPNFYQFVPTEKGFEDRVLRIAPSTAESKERFDDLNFARNFSRITGYNRFVPRRGAVVYAWASIDIGTVKAGTAKPPTADPLLVGLKTGVEDRGRVLAFAAFDSYFWMRFGQPELSQGVDVHTKFWRQCVLWLAHQEEEEGEVYARPEFPELPVGGTQTVRVGLKAPEGGDDPDAVLSVKVLAPGDYDPKELKGRSIEAAARDENSSIFRGLAKATPRTIERDQTGSKFTLRPKVPGEYLVVVTTPAYKIGADGRPGRGPDGKFLRDPDKIYVGGAGFDVEPEDTDETLIVAADPEFLAKIAGASGGKSIRLEDLPAFLRELKTAGMPNLRPRPKFVPDWRRNHSKGFLPLWLVVFTALLGTEWGLRRLWGMV
jgi:hypothetical protein